MRQSWSSSIGFNALAGSTKHPGNLAWTSHQKMPNIRVHCNHEHLGVEGPPIKRCGGFMIEMKESRLRCGLGRYISCCKHVLIRLCAFVLCMEIHIQSVNVSFMFLPKACIVKVCIILLQFLPPHFFYIVVFEKSSLHVHLNHSFISNRFSFMKPQ